MIEIRTFIEALQALDNGHPFFIPVGTKLDDEEIQFLLRKVANTGWICEDDPSAMRWTFRKRTEGDPGFTRPLETYRSSNPQIGGE